MKNPMKFVLPGRMSRIYNKAQPRIPTPHKKLIPALPSDVNVRKSPMLMPNATRILPRDQLYPYRLKITALFKYERIKLPYHQAVAVREYSERLICEAIRYGDRHIPTMELADYYLFEKQLVHKLFKVLVPRYALYDTSFTKLYNLGVDYQEGYPDEIIPYRHHGKALGVLELKENPLPPIIPPTKVSKKYYLTNVLLDAAKEDFYKNNKKNNGQSSLETETVKSEPELVGHT